MYRKRRLAKTLGLPSSLELSFTTEILLPLLKLKNLEKFTYFVKVHNSELLGYGVSLSHNNKGTMSTFLTPVFSTTWK